MAWQALNDQLTEAASAWGRPVEFWWRDDDATVVNAALGRLLDISRNHNAPLLVAVIPAPTRQGLSERLAQTGVERVMVAQHGYGHRNRAQPEAKKSEFPETRSNEENIADIIAGRDRMDELFGKNWSRIFVPPWNRMSESSKAALPSLGFRGFSGFAPRKIQADVNTHVDVIDWHETRKFRGEEVLIQEIITQIRGRVEGKFDAAEPIGILSHHLVQDAACWAFLDKLIGYLMKHSQSRLLRIDDCFPH